nr:MAG TPA: hypothetical protein [Caudoviricetes sp.]
MEYVEKFATTATQKADEAASSAAEAKKASQDTEAAKETAVSAINTAKSEAADEINTEKSGALSAIGEKKTESLQELSKKQGEALNEISKSVSTAQDAAGTAVQEAAAAAGSASNAAKSEKNAKASETESAKNLQGTKEYFEQVRTITIGAQGWYATPEALKAAVPVGENGWWAVVGTTDTIWTWDGDTGAWVDTRKEVDLSDYLTQDQIKKLLEQYMPLRPATAAVLGGVKVGGGLSVTADGTLSTNIVASTTAPPADLSAYPDGTLWIVYKDTAADEAVDDTDIHMPADETGDTETTGTEEPPVLVDADGVPEEG